MKKRAKRSKFLLVAILIVVGVVIVVASAFYLTAGKCGVGLSPSTGGPLTLEEIKSSIPGTLIGREAREILRAEFSKDLSDPMNVARLRDMDERPGIFKDIFILPDSEGNPKYLSRIDAVNDDWWQGKCRVRVVMESFQFWGDDTGFDVPVSRCVDVNGDCERLFGGQNWWIIFPASCHQNNPNSGPAGQVLGCICTLEIFQ